jgi:glycosyltransferase involved in cell wall biosynthesis
MPIISVVIPTRNRPAMLNEALASVRAQTFTDYEIIVVSNGESAEMRRKSRCVAYAAGAMYFALDQGNVPAARNFGIGRAKGEWVAMLDDDDLWMPKKLECQIEATEHTGADIIASDYIEFYGDGREILREPRLPQGWSHTKAINHLFWWANPSGVIVRRSAFDAVGGFDVRQRYCEDNDLWRRISWRHRIHHVEEALFRYRQGHASMMQRERLRYLYDIRFFFKTIGDTPRDLRATLPDASFFWNRVMIIWFPKWLARKVELTVWGGAKWHRLLPKFITQPFNPTRLRRRWKTLCSLARHLRPARLLG